MVIFLRKKDTNKLSSSANDFHRESRKRFALGPFQISAFQLSDKGELHNKHGTAGRRVL